MKNKIIIVSPSLNEQENISGISSVTKFIIKLNKEYEYIHFCLGKKDLEKSGIRRIIKLFISYIKWIKLLFNNNTIIHYNFPLSKPSIIRDPIFIITAILLRKKILLHIHGGVFLFSKQIPFIYNLILKNIFKLKIPFIVLSEKEKQVLQHRFKCNKIYSLPNSIDIEDALLYKKEINKTQPLTIGYLGRITEDKGIDYLLLACNKLKEIDIKYKLKIAGSEENNTHYVTSFKETLGDTFIYNGILFGKAKESFLKEIDIFILPSFFEGLPMALIECMSYGVVPITTNVGSINEFVKEHINGIFIKTKDINSIINAILVLNKDRNLLEKLSINAQECISTHFKPYNYIKQLNNIYESLKE